MLKFNCLPLLKIVSSPCFTGKKIKVVLESSFFFTVFDYSKICQMSRIMGKPDFWIRENKDADQLHGNRAADQRLCQRYIDSTIPLLP